MGTRSITTVTSNWPGGEEPIHHATIYRHWDGYPEGHGSDLAHYLEPVEVTNGSKPGQYQINGPGRLASFIVHQLFLDGHDPDLMPKDAVCGQEYHYNVHVDYGPAGGTIGVRVFNGPMTFFGTGGEKCDNLVFAGTVQEFAQWCDEDDEEEDTDEY